MIHFGQFIAIQFIAALQNHIAFIDTLQSPLQRMFSLIFSFLVSFTDINR